MATPKRATQPRNVPNPYTETDCSSSREGASSGGVVPAARALSERIFFCNLNAHRSSKRVADKPALS